MEPLLIIGAGPSGLAAAACLKQAGVGFVLIDKNGRAGGAFCRMDRNLKLLSPRRYVSLPGLAYPGTEEYATMPDYENYLAAYAQHFGLALKPLEVTRVSRAPEGFEVKTTHGFNLQCRLLIVASGLFDCPVWPEIEGLAAGTSQGHPVVLHSKNWTGSKTFASRRILIIGVGISGVSIAEECARAGLHVLVSHRSKRVWLVPPLIFGRDILDWFRPVEFLPRAFFGSLCRRGVHPPAYDNGYRELVRTAKIIELPEVKKVEGTKIFCVDGRCYEADIIIAATGYRYACPFLPPEVQRMPGGHPDCRDCESLDWPGLFFVGAPCGRGIDSEFLRGIASDARRVATKIRARLG